jgi:hypothetical protein
VVVAERQMPSSLDFVTVRKNWSHVLRRSLDSQSYEACNCYLHPLLVKTFVSLERADGFPYCSRTAFKHLAVDWECICGKCLVRNLLCE